MDGPPNIDVRSSFEFMAHEFFFTRAGLRKHPLTQALVADFDAFWPEWVKTYLDYMGLIGERYDAQAAIWFLDADLDALALAITNAILIETNNDRSAPLFMRFYANIRPSELRKPIMGEQLDTMRAWPPSLKALPNVVLQGYGAELEAKVVQADSSVKDKETVEQKIKDYQMLGPRFALVNFFNGLRKSTYGKLADIQHTHPELPSDWARSFFKHDSAERVTVKDLDRKIASAKAELAALEKQREELVAREEAAEQAKLEAERTQKMAALAAARRRIEEAAAEATALEAELAASASKK